MDFINRWIVPQEATASPGVYIAVAVVALFLMAVSKSGFGGGVGMISVPLMLQVAPPSFVIGFWLPILIACDIATIRKYPKEWEPRVVTRLGAGMVVGIVLTSLLLRQIVKAVGEEREAQNTAWLKLGIALIVMVFLAMQRLSRGESGGAPWRPSFLVSIPIGLVAGITTTLAHAAGPIVTMYMLPQQLGKRTFVGTTGRFYFIFNSFKVPILVVAGAITAVTFRYGIWMIVLSPLGVWLGAWLNRKVSKVWFVRLINVFLMLAAIKLLYDGTRVVLA